MRTIEENPTFKGQIVSVLNETPAYVMTEIQGHQSKEAIKRESRIIGDEEMQILKKLLGMY
ncbi:MAG: hypothetical protein ABFC94_02800 [Syntrophomonas sp.]